MGKNEVSINLKLGKVTGTLSFESSTLKTINKISAAKKKLVYKLSGKELLNKIDGAAASAIKSISLSEQIGGIKAKLNSTTLGKALASYRKITSELAAIQTQCEKAVKRTVSDVKSRAPAQVKRAVREIYGINAQTMTDAGKSAKLSSTPSGSLQLIYSGRPLSPVPFQMTPKTREASQGKVIKAKILGQKKPLPEDAFLGNNGSGTYLPFQRVGDARLPLRAIKTVSVPQMIDNEEVRAILSAKLEELLANRLSHNMSQVKK